MQSFPFWQAQWSNYCLGSSHAAPKQLEQDENTVSELLTFKLSSMQMHRTYVLTEALF